MVDICPTGLPELCEPSRAYICVDQPKCVKIIKRETYICCTCQGIQQHRGIVLNMFGMFGGHVWVMSGIVLGTRLWTSWDRQKPTNSYSIHPCKKTLNSSNSGFSQGFFEELIFPKDPTLRKGFFQALLGQEDYIYIYIYIYIGFV